MEKNVIRVGLISLLFLGFLILVPQVLSSVEPFPDPAASSSRWSLSLNGGYANSESRGGMMDLTAEVQFRFSPKFWTGVSIGYLSDSDNDHMSGNSSGMGGGMMGGGMMGGFTGHSHDFHAVPLVVSLYYGIPLNPRFDVYLLGGGGYYWSSFKDISTEKKGAFGPHAGIGVDFKVARQITVNAQGIYRFVSLKGFTNELHQGFMEQVVGGEQMMGFWHYNSDLGEYHFHQEGESFDQMMMDSPSYNIDLNGISLRAGIKFSF